MPLKSTRELKRILITAHHFPPDANGLSHSSAVQAYGLARRGYDVTVATAYVPARSDAQRRGNPAVVEFKTWGNGNLRVGYHGEVQEYRDFVARFDADVIICQGWNIWATDLAYQAFGASTAKKVIIGRGVWGKGPLGFPRTIPTWLGWRPYIWRMPRMMRAFDHLVFLTGIKDGRRFYDRLLADRLGLSNVSVIPNGADVQWLDEDLPDFRSHYGIGDRPMLLCLANYGKLKNQGLALRAFQRSAVGDAVLVFIGSRMNDYARSLQSQSQQWRRRGNSGEVLFLEGLDRSTLYAAYCAADVFLCPSRAEAQPRVVLDAMGAGLPFISTDVGCVREFPGGVIVTSEGDMAKQITRLLHDPEERRRLGDAGQAATRDYYNQEHVLDEYESLIQGLLS